MLTKLKLFLKKYWYLLLFALATVVLFIRRAVVLRYLSNLRAQLTASRRKLEEYEHAKARATALEEIERADVAIKAERETITALEGRLAEEEPKHEATLRAINEAKTWEDLARLRAEGNAQ